MVAEKDFHAPKHPELETIPNLQVKFGNIFVIIRVDFEPLDHFRSIG